MVALKHLNNFWRTLEMPLINCEINLFLTCLEYCFIIADAIDIQVPTFAITSTKLYVPVVTLSINDNGWLFKKEAIKNWLKRTCSWNTYWLTNTVNGLFISSFKVNAHWRSYKQYFGKWWLEKNFGGNNFFDLPA